MLQRAAQSQQGSGLEPFKRLLPIPPTLKPVRSDATIDYDEITLRTSRFPKLDRFDKDLH